MLTGVRRCAALFALLGVGCVDVDSRPLPATAPAPRGPAEVILPNGTRFEGCPAGTALRGYPEVRDADATYCVTIVEPARRQGPYLSFYPSGKLLAKGFYLDGNPDRAWTTYHENGQPLSDGFYLRGIRDGAWKFRRDDGKLVLEEQLASGARVSWVEYTYEKGVFRESDSFVMDAARREVLHGPSTSVRDGGNILSGNFQQGKGQGLWEEKTAKGVVVARFTMNAGFAEGKAEVFWPETGKLAAQGQLVKTLPQGVWTLYFPGGEKRADLTYDKGILRSFKVYFQNGKEQLGGELLDGAPHASWTSHHEEGPLHVSGTFFRGIRQGMWRSADSSGKTVAEGLYENGVLVDGQKIEPIVPSSLGLRESLGGLFSDLAYITAGHGKVESEQRSIAECMMLGDPAEKCLSLDWECFRPFHANDGPAEIERRNKQQDLACAMNNPAACARVGKRLALEAESAKDKKKALADAAGYYQKACDLAPLEAAWKARDATAKNMLKEFHSGLACVWLGGMLESGDARSKVQSGADLYKRACEMGIEEGCSAASAAAQKPKPKTPGKPEPKAVPAPAPKTEPKAVPAPAPKTEPKAAPPLAPKPEPKAPPVPAPKPGK